MGQKRILRRGTGKSRHLRGVIGKRPMNSEQKELRKKIREAQKQETKVAREKRIQRLLALKKN